MGEVYTRSDPPAPARDVCQTCGVPVADVRLHDDWHRQVRISAGQPVPARDMPPPRGSV